MKIKPKILNFAVWMWGNIPSSLRAFYYRTSAGFSLGSIFLPDRVEVAKIAGGLNKGLRMRLNLSLYRRYYFGTYEKDIQSVLAKFVQRGMTVYNIGANIGFHTLALTTLVGSKGLIVAFEPNPGVRKKLMENLVLNRLNNHVRVEEFALSDFDGRANFSLSLSDGQGRFEDLPYVKPGASIQVPCKRLDTYVAERGHRPDFILMDVEYAEGRVLRGMSQVMEEHKPIILVEMHSRASIEESLNELERHRYVLLNVPDLQVVNDFGNISRGHYLATHAAYLKSSRPPIITVQAVGSSPKG